MKRLSWFDEAILTILGIAGIRDIIAFMGFVPVDKKFSWLIYGKYDDAIIERVLIHLGYSKRHAEEIHKGLSSREKKALTDVDIDTCYRRLISIISTCIIPLEDEMRYGNCSTRYYIHTMQGSRDDKISKAMAFLLMKLIRAKSDRDNGSMPDYIIVPKSGNTRLGQLVADYLGIKCILHKSKDDNSYARAGMGSSDEIVLDYKINFEGAIYLNTSRPLKGIVLDCNASNGTSLIDTALSFNRVIDHLEFKFPPITEIYTLFRANDTNIDHNLQAQKLSLYRYFDLTEEIKEDIAKLPQDDVNIFPDENSPTNVVLQKMRTKRLLCFE